MIRFEGICGDCGSLVFSGEEPPDRDVLRELEEARAAADVAIKVVRGDIVSVADVKRCSPAFVSALMGGAAFGEKRDAAREALAQVARSMVPEPVRVRRTRPARRSTERATG